MSLFLLVFLVLYGLANLYVFAKLGAVIQATAWRVVVGLLLAAMAAAPVLVHMLDRARHFRMAKPFGAVTYTWLAVVMWFCVLAAAVDLWNLAMRAFGASGKRAMLPPQVSLAGIGALVVAGLVWGFIEAQRIRVQHVVIDVPNLPAGLENLRLVQITDLHLGIHTGQRRLERTVELARQLKPDILISTGDLVDSPLEEVMPLAPLLRELQAPLGKFAVLGNHEYYAGLGTSLAFHREAGFKLLRGQAVSVTEELVLAGVDDQAGNYTNQECHSDESAALGQARPAGVVVLLKHQPRVSQASLGRFDLQLSGHTHGGQVFPWHLLARLVYPMYQGLHKLPQDCWLYASRGSGTWGPKIRLFARPEVTLITFRRAQ